MDQKCSSYWDNESDPKNDNPKAVQGVLPNSSTILEHHVDNEINSKIAKIPATGNNNVAAKVVAKYGSSISEKKMDFKPPEFLFPQDPKGDHYKTSATPNAKISKTPSTGKKNTVTKIVDEYGSDISEKEMTFKPPEICIPPDPDHNYCIISNGNYGKKSVESHAKISKNPLSGKKNDATKVVDEYGSDISKKKMAFKPPEIYFPPIATLNYVGDKIMKRKELNIYDKKSSPGIPPMMKNELVHSMENKRTSKMENNISEIPTSIPFSDVHAKTNPKKEEPIDHQLSQHEAEQNHGSSDDHMNRRPTLLPGAYAVSTNGTARQMAYFSWHNLISREDTTKNELQKEGEIMDAEVTLQAESKTDQENRKTRKSRKFWLNVTVLITISGILSVIVPIFLLGEIKITETNNSSKSTRYTSMRNKFLQVSSSTSLDRAGTPQNKALSWIANESASHEEKDYPNLIQRYILAVMYYSFDIRASMLFGSNWLKKIPECEWDWVECRGYNVTSLDLGDKFLKGTLPIELGKLDSIEQLVFNDNQISSQIPIEFAGLINIKKLLLNDNKISGKIPNIIGDFTKLEELMIGNNQITSTIPSGFGSLSRLRKFSVQQNSMTGSVPSELFSLEYLVYLDLSKNSFNGTIPAEINGLKSIKHFDLFSNRIASSIPSEIISLIFLEMMDMGYNDINGTIPTEIGNLTSLEYLSLTNNNLVGTLPSNIGMLTKLNSLFLKFNKLTGTISEEIVTGCNALDRLDLSENNLNGTIPSTIQKLSSLSILGLGQNFFKGHIPAEIGNLTNMRVMFFPNNYLSGNVPSEIANLKLLEELKISFNDLTGTISDDICNLRHLNQFDADCRVEVQCSCCDFCE